MEKNHKKLLIAVGMMFIFTIGYICFSNQVVDQTNSAHAEDASSSRNSRQQRNADIRDEALQAEARLARKYRDKHSGNTDYNKDEKNAQWNMEERKAQLEEALSTMKDAPAMAGSIKADLQRQLDNLNSGEH